MVKKRVVIRIQLSTVARNELTVVGERLGVPKTRIMNRLLEWFFAQPPIIRSFITRLVPADMAEQTAKLALTRFYK